MGIISYGRSVKPVVKDNARTRRHMRRMVEAIECRKIEEILVAELGWESPTRSAEITRVETITRLSRVEKALYVRPSNFYDSLDNCCLPQVAIFSVRDRKKTALTARVKRSHNRA